MSVIIAYYATYLILLLACYKKNKNQLKENNLLVAYNDELEAQMDAILSS